MTSKYMEYLLLKQHLRQKAVEFTRTVIVDPNCRLDPQLSFVEGDSLDLVINEARSDLTRLLTVAEYLEVPANREFAKLFLLCLVSTAHPFQPSREKGWESFGDLINELLVERLILDPLVEAAHGRYLQGPDDADDYLIEPAGETFIWTAFLRLQLRQST